MADVRDGDGQDGQEEQVDYMDYVIVVYCEVCDKLAVSTALGAHFQSEDIKTDAINA